jgi:hypothetical protein
MLSDWRLNVGFFEEPDIGFANRISTLRSPDLVPVVFAGEGKRNEPEKYLQNGRQLG